MISNILLYTMIAAVISFALGQKLKAVRWSFSALFLGYVGFQLYGLYGQWGMVETHNIFSLGSINFSLNFGITKLGWFFAFFTTIINIMIWIFSIVKNMNEKEERGINFLWILLAGSNLAIFFSVDWITFFIAWEIMTWTSFFIITPGWKNSFKAANWYFILSMFGAYAMLVGIWWLYATPAIHTLNIASSIALLAKLSITAPGTVGIIIALFVLSFFAKSAVFPFHPWPAEAHAEAPDDFSPYLSGIMIKYGLYGILLFIIPLFIQIMKVNPNIAMVNGIPVYSYIFAWFGAITAVLGAYLAIVSNDMKKLAAYSTVSNIGYAVTSMFILSSAGVTGGLFHVVNHAVFKSAIFLSLGAVKFRTHEREMHRLGGLATKMPITFLTFLLGIIAAAGIPPLNGYASKWIIYQALLSGHFPFLTTMIFLASTGAFLYLFRALHSIFLGQLPRKFNDVKEVPFLMQIPMILGMLLMLGIGYAPGIVLKPIGLAVKAMGLTPMTVENTLMVGKLSSINTAAVYLTFAGSFIFAFAFYLIGKKRHHVEPLDNYTAGQDPEEYGLTPELYHFALKFYEPVKNIFRPMEEKLNIKNYYRALVRNANSFGATLSEMFKLSGAGSSMIFVLGLVVIILAGWML